MYARNYGATSKNPKIVFEQAQQHAPTDTEKIPIKPEQSSETVSDPERDEPKSDTSPSKSEKNAKPKTEASDTECDPPTLFGEHGIPRQPLRRRKLPNKPKTASQCDIKAQDEAAPTKDIPRHTEPTHEPTQDSDRHADCHYKPDSPLRRHISAFSSEELLLAGLILLLINDRGNDDVILMLGFLLVSGFSGD